MSHAVPLLFLHIGINKTGSSAIQRFLAENARMLLRHGVLYPRAGRHENAHYLLSRALGFGPAERSHDVAEVASARTIERLRVRLETEARRHPAARVVLSSEQFVRPLDPWPVRGFLAAFDCRIVVYLRRHDHWWASAYGQALKTVAHPPWGMGPEAYIAWSQERHPGQRRYRPLLERWCGVFGGENIIVRPYEPMQNPDGVVADFLHTIGVPGLAVQASTAVDRVNASLDAGTLALLEIVQRSGLDARMQRRLRRRLVDTAIPAADTRILPPALRCELLEENRADYAWIAHEFLQRDDGRLFLEPEPALDEEWDAVSVPDDDPSLLPRLLHWLETA